MQDLDSFVISENDYIDYLSGTNTAQLPVNIARRIRHSHFLFLGYSLKGSNFQVVLHRFSGNHWLGWNSWDQPKPDSVEEQSWYGRSVEPLDARLEEYIDLLSAALLSASTPTGEPS
jgi:hypothetical protein